VIEATVTVPWKMSTDRRPHALLVHLPTGHTVHETDPDGFATAVREFLGSLEADASVRH
jgi:esterase